MAIKKGLGKGLDSLITNKVKIWFRIVDAKTRHQREYLCVGEVALAVPLLRHRGSRDPQQLRYGFKRLALFPAKPFQLCVIERCHLFSFPCLDHKHNI